MTRALVKLAIVVLAIGCGTPPPSADGGADAAQSPIDAANEGDAGQDASAAVDAGSEARWGVRSCDLTLRYAPRRGERDVRVAGEFTSWADAAQPMRDDDGDGVYELTLSPNARLVPGERYAYKLIVGGTWMLDPSSALREYVDGCLNSAFVMPACTRGPEIRASELVTSIDGGAGRATSSIFNLRAALASRFEQGGERLFLVGETAVGEHDRFDLGCGESFSDGYEWIDAYVGEHALDGQFDFPTHHRLQDGLVTEGMSFEDVEAVVHAFETRYRPEGLHVRFLGTHDSNRMASRAAFDPAQGCRWPDDGGCASMPEQPADPAVFARLRRAFTVLYTMGGIPFVYYGDELAMPGGNDPDNRRDMVFTGPLASLAMGATSVSDEQAALRAHLAALGTARARSMALRRGRRIPLLATEHLYVYAYAHEASGELAVVSVNRGGELSDFAVDGLTSVLLGGIGSFEVAAGSGSLARSGTRLRLTMDAGGAAVFLGRP